MTKPRCLCNGMNKATGYFCGFLDMAAQYGHAKCPGKCEVLVPAAWIKREEEKRAARVAVLVAHYTTAQLETAAQAEQARHGRLVQARAARPPAPAVKTAQNRHFAGAKTAK